MVLAAGCASSPDPVAMKTDYDVIVVGAGLGGLSAATHLALNDMKVLVLEQHDRVGGCATLFERDVFVFDASLHAMAGGGPGKNDRALYQLHKLWGIDSKVELIELPEFYRSIFPGVDITLPGNWDGFKQALKTQWPDEAGGIEKFHDICKSTYMDMLALRDLYRYGSVKAFWTKAQVPLRYRSFYRYKDKTFQDVLDECFDNKDLKAVVSQLWIYYGAPVTEQSALIGLAATETYLSDGVWHVRGTSQALSNAYAERIRELGGVVKTNSMVTEITMENQMATGVRTKDGKHYTSKYVITNTDPWQMVFRLVGENHFPEKYVTHLQSMKPANSLFGVYMGLDADLAARGYNEVEIVYSPKTADSEVLYNAMMDGDYKNGAVAITIYTNLGDPVYAPPGKSVVTLTAYSDIDFWPDYGKKYYEVKEQKVDELVALAAEVIPELADPSLVLVKEGFTPRTLNRYTMNRKGVVYGFYLSPDQWQKIPNCTPVPNLFIASNWTQTWHGMGSAQVNGLRAAQLILDSH
jgi:prolycopene isomerase